MHEPAAAERTAPRSSGTRSRRSSGSPADPIRMKDPAEIARRLDELQQKIGIAFKSPALLQEALSHSSFANENPTISPHDNERLEYLGDAVLQLISAEFLFRGRPGAAEGEMTQVRSSMVNTQALAALSEDLGMGEFLLLGKGIARGGGRNLRSLLANAFEAVLGAIFLDQGYDAAYHYCMERFRALPDAEVPENFKGRPPAPGAGSLRGDARLRRRSAPVLSRAASGNTPRSSTRAAIRSAPATVAPSRSPSRRPRRRRSESSPGTPRYPPGGLRSCRTRFARTSRWRTCSPRSRRSRRSSRRRRTRRRFRKRPSRSCRRSHRRPHRQRSCRSQCRRRSRRRRRRSRRRSRCPNTRRSRRRRPNRRRSRRRRSRRRRSRRPALEEAPVAEPPSEPSGGGWRSRRRGCRTRRR